ncbi:hypothetical protein QBC47DRAFT_329577 [Echria macrotheca]|uniref:Uncharacterized protein n=1 Tax=Echria macrotheca TaxID=438768 RepID=A0AAJ0B510_9PEZI|nr:hypothetical protein QBC47DRAFT_329577 [Echria macrotheca]
MDPTTTLFTFMLHTHPSVQAVHLVGSWDNFGRAYSMERDIRRDRGQWRGCYSFKDIICDGDGGSLAPKRNGGLKMGQTYYYYYELDGSSETHDPALPTTNACPYLPGQTVNTLWVPIEQSSRKRSASLNSVREEDFKTMNPADKFTTPRPAPVPPTPETSTFRRVGSAPRLHHKRSARSLSPGSGWTFSPRRLFTRKPSFSSLTAEPEAQAWDERSVRSSDGSRSRDISPESLRRYLVDDDAVPSEEPETDRPAIAIPEDIVEELEDDDNFATSAVSESLPFTGLSPPPTQRSVTPSPSVTPVPLGNDAVAEVVEISAPAPPTRSPPMVPQLDLSSSDNNNPIPQSRFSFSDASYYSPQSPDSHSLPSFYHSEDEDDDERISSSNEEEEEDLSISLSPLHRRPANGRRSSFVRDLDAALSTYSLPQTSTHDHSAAEKLLRVDTGSSPALLASDVSAVGRGSAASLLTSPIPNSGLEELVSELGWMAEVIRGKDV